METVGPAATDNDDHNVKVFIKTNINNNFMTDLYHSFITSPSL